MTTLITVPHFSPIYNVHTNLDGATNFISCAAVTPFPSSEFTIECWINSATTQPGTLFAYYPPGQQGFFLLAVTNITNLNIYINMQQTGPTGVSLNDGEWHLLSISWLSYSGELNIYVDGALQTTKFIGGSNTIDEGQMLVMGQNQVPVGSGSSTSLAADIGEFRLWNRARTDYFIDLDSQRTLTGSDIGTRWQYIDQFQVINNKLQKLLITFAAPATEESVMLLDSNRGLWFTSDFGKTLTALTSPAVPLAQITGSATNNTSGAIYYGLDTSNGIWLSSDNGANWSQPNAGSLLSQIDTGPDYACGLSSGQVYFYSSSQGANWTQGDSTKFLWTAINSKAAWAVNTQGQLMISASRAGNDWVAVANSPVLIKIYASETLLLGIDSSGVMHASSIDGLLWREIYSPDLQSFYSASMFQNVSWAVNTSGQVMFGEIDTQMFLHWQMDEGYGTLAYDSSNHNNHGILGDEEPGTVPTWEVASMLEPPGFVYFDIQTFISSYGITNDPAVTNMQIVSAGGDPAAAVAMATSTAVASARLTTDSATATAAAKK